jgi:hypothetical protein
MSTWKCIYYALVCCLGSHTLKWLVGWCIYRPHLNYSRWRKSCSLYSPMMGNARSGALSSAPLAIGSVSRPLALSAFAPDSPGPPPQCHQELAVGLLFSGAPDSPVCWTVRCPRPDSPPVATHFFVSWTLLDIIWSSLVIFIMSSFEVLLSSMS